MKRALEPWQNMERDLIKGHRKELWNPFIYAVQRYELVRPGDRIAVCVSGGKDSMLLAKLMQELHRHSIHPFEAAYLVMDPGYSRENREKIEANAARLHIPLTFFDTEIFSAAFAAEKNPCYLCARMRRGALYAKARDLGCNKIALGHHFNDVVETTVLAMFYGSQLQGMMPKLHSTHFPGMELIRPLYCVHEEDITAWSRRWGLEFLQCACRFTERAQREEISKRREIKELLRSLRQKHPDIEKCIFQSIHNVCLDTFPSYKTHGKQVWFLDGYEEK